MNAQQQTKQVELCLTTTSGEWGDPGEGGNSESSWYGTRSIHQESHSTETLDRTTTWDAEGQAATTGTNFRTVSASGSADSYSHSEWEDHWWTIGENRASGGTYENSTYDDYDYLCSRDETWYEAGGSDVLELASGHVTGLENGSDSGWWEVVYSDLTTDGDDWSNQWNNSYDQQVDYPGFYEGAYYGNEYGGPNPDEYIEYLGDAFTEGQPGSSGGFFELLSNDNAVQAGAQTALGEAVAGMVAQSWQVVPGIVDAAERLGPEAANSATAVDGSDPVAASEANGSSSQPETTGATGETVVVAEVPSSGGRCVITRTAVELPDREILLYYNVWFYDDMVNFYLLPSTKRLIKQVTVKCSPDDLEQAEAKYDKLLTDLAISYRGSDTTRDFASALEQTRKRAEEEARDLVISAGLSKIAKLARLGKLSSFVDDAAEHADDVARYADDAVRALSKAEQAAIDKIDNIVRDHLKPHDWTGTLRDMVGNPVPKPGGGFYKHYQEMNDTLRGLRKAVKALENSSHPDAQAARRRALELIKRIETFTQGAGI